MHMKLQSVRCLLMSADSYIRSGFQVAINDIFVKTMYDMPPYCDCPDRTCNNNSVKCD